MVSHNAMYFGHDGMIRVDEGDSWGFGFNCVFRRTSCVGLG